MTRKDQMREGFVTRTFHIPIDIDDELRMMAIKTHVRFSDIAIVAFKHYLQKSSDKLQEMRFFNKLGGLISSSSTSSAFDKIEDYDDVKDIVRRALDAM